jgi:hypothetical protein
MQGNYSQRTTNDFNVFWYYLINNETILLYKYLTLKEVVAYTNFYSKIKKNQVLLLIINVWLIEEIDPPKEDLYMNQLTIFSKNKYK